VVPLNAGISGVYHATGFVTMQT